MSQVILSEIYRLISVLPPETLRQLASYLSMAACPYSDKLAHQLVQKEPNHQFRRAIQDLLITWRDDSLASWNSKELAIAIASASHTIHTEREMMHVDLVWTGPETATMPIRRTEQVLLQLIRETQIQLSLISFAIYKIPTIVETLLVALDHGIKLRIITETPESGDAKIPFGPQATFDRGILERAQVFIWPKDQRPIDHKGRHGSLHIKGAISDQQKIFITSANLTEYAMVLNMELGVLINNRRLAVQIDSQIDNLIKEGILVML